MSQSDHQTEIDTSNERMSALLADLHVTSLVEDLPPNVFPVAAGLTMRRETSDDSVFMDYKPPEYPLPIRKPEGAYIPNRTVYFENPAEIADNNRKTWPYHEFVDSFREQLQDVDELGPNPEDRIYITHLRIVEIPSAYVTTDGGHPAASERLYQNEAEMTIGYFSKFTELQAQDVKEELGDALPDETEKPLRLNRIDEVTAKPYDGGATQSKRRYYTAGQANSSESYDRTPKIWASERFVRDRETRPLDVAVGNIDRFFPALSDSQFLKRFKFFGSEKSSSFFVADEVSTMG